MNIDNNRLAIDPDEDFDYRFDPSPNISIPNQAAQKYLVIHATEGPSVAAAVGTFKIKKSKESRSGLSVHLVLGKDGKEIVQMLAFNQGGVHASQYNKKSIGIELDYPGDLRESGSKYQLRSEYREDQYILANALNDARFRYWPLYPKEQIDALFKICRALIDHYETTDLVGHEELYSYKMDPGPAFPITHFREQLLGVSDRSIVLQETVEEVRLRNKPGEQAVFLTETVIPPHAPVSIVNQSDDWYLITAHAEIEGHRWLIGWVERRAIGEIPHTLAIRPDHYLGTQEGRRFRVIEPDPNNYDNKHPIIGPKYAVIHFTTGTRIESTIAHFRNAAAQACAHLLIGRDGRIIQFLPFNKIAYHAGYSWWEGDRSLNSFSVGIELDNAGFLKESNGIWKRLKTIIPSDWVTKAVHWRESKERGWENFTPAQLEVTLNILKILKEYYGITEILGHDQINLRERLDPGPLFPMESFREQLFGHAKPLCAEFRIKGQADLYTNDGGRLPNARDRLHDVQLPKGSIVKVMREAEDWTLINVIKSSGTSLRGSNGWVRTNTLRSLDTKGAKRQGKKEAERKSTKVSQEYYKKGDQPPTPRLRVGPFPTGTRVRIQERRGEWTLVALLDEFKGLKGLEGWLQSGLVEPAV